MILDFDITSKDYHQKIFIESSTHTFYQCQCDYCGCIGRFHRHGSYSRYLILFQSQLSILHILQILRVQCVSCKKTHSVLPSDVIPFQLHSMPYLLALFVTFTQLHSTRSTAKFMQSSRDVIRNKLLLFRKFLPSIEAYLRESGQFDSSSNLSLETALSFLSSDTFDRRSYFRTHHMPLFLNRRGAVFKWADFSRLKIAYEFRNG